MHEVTWLKDLMLVLAAASIVVPVFGRLRLGVVPGFLLAGLILGPGGLGHFAHDIHWLGYVTFSEPEGVRPVAELGVLFLLFLIGLEFSVERLWSIKRLVFGFGSAQALVSAAVIVPVALWLIGAAEPALVIGLALALSSTAIVTQFLIETHRFTLPVGRAALGVLLFQDLLVVPLVVVVGLLGGEDVRLSWGLAWAVLAALGAVAVVILGARFVVRPFIALAARTESRELLVAISLFVVIGTSLLTAAVGLSPALGAFLAGIILGSSEYRHQIEVDIEPFKGLLLGLFFMTVGMSLDLAVIFSNPLPLLAATLALMAGKAVIAFLAALVFGLAVPVAIESALLLAGAGEFAFVLLSLAADRNIMGPELHAFVVTMAALSMFATPVLGTLGRRFAERLSRKTADRDHGAGIAVSDLSDHVIIGGFGRVGQAVARALEAERIPYVALDTDAELIAKHRRAGRNVYFGDASRREILDRVGGKEARAFVVTPNKPIAAERMVEAICSRWPAASVHARAADVAHAEQLMAAGAADVVPEALESSMVLAGHVLTALGLPDDDVEARIATQREEEVARLARTGEDRPTA